MGLAVLSAAVVAKPATLAALVGKLDGNRVDHEWACHDHDKRVCDSAFVIARLWRHPAVLEQAGPVNHRSPSRLRRSSEISCFRMTWADASEPKTHDRSLTLRVEAENHHWAGVAVGAAAQGLSDVHVLSQFVTSASWFSGWAGSRAAPSSSTIAALAASLEAVCIEFGTVWKNWTVRDGPC